MKKLINGVSPNNQMFSYKYCVNCGERTIKKSANLYVCSICDFHFFLNPKPTAGNIIVNSNGDVLLIKRAKDPKKGYWDIPGGFIKFNEAAQNAAKREAFEELGLKLNQLKYLTTVPSPYTFKGMNYWTICIVFFSKVTNDQIMKIDTLEVSAYSFFPINEIPFNQLAFKNVSGAVKSYLSLVQSGVQ